MLSFQRLAVGYGRKALAENLCATLPVGTMTVLFGPNGAGKSTLLRTIAGLHPAIEGEIRLNGRPLAAYTPRTLARTLSIVLTRRTETETLTARETVETGRIPYSRLFVGMNEEDRRAVRRALDLTDTRRLADRRLSSLSDGERGRVFIAKALAQATPVILLDEPTAFLDFAAKVSAFRLLRRLAHEEGKTILLSTHDVETALPFADRLWLFDGRTLDCGTPTELSANGTLERFFARDGLCFDSRSMRFRYEAAR